MDAPQMKSLLQFLKQINDSILISVILKGYGLIMITWGLASYFNISPYYQIKLYKTNSITPILYLFPGEPVRLGFDAHKVISNDEINSLYWYLIKNNTVILKDEGQALTIKLPPTIGGTYQLRATLNLTDNTTLTGQSNFYVVQDIPNQVPIPEKTNVALSTGNNSSEFLTQIKKQGAEIYSKNGWVKVPVVTSPQGELKLEINKNETISTYNDQMFIRAQGAENKLGSYGTVAAPIKTLTPIKSLNHD